MTKATRQLLVKINLLETQRNEEIESLEKRRKKLAESEVAYRCKRQEIIDACWEAEKKKTTSSTRLCKESYGGGNDYNIVEKIDYEVTSIRTGQTKEEFKHALEHLTQA